MTWPLGPDGAFPSAAEADDFGQHFTARLKAVPFHKQLYPV